MAQDLRRSQTSVQPSSSATPSHRRGMSDSFFSNPEDFFRMNPFQLMRHFSEEMDRMWTGSGRSGEGYSAESSLWRPRVDVCERNGQLQVRADLPGVNENDVTVQIENDTLI